MADLKEGYYWVRLPDSNPKTWFIAYRTSYGEWFPSSAHYPAETVSKFEVQATRIEPPQD